MNNDQIIGAARQFGGEIQEAMGRVFGNESQQFRGRLNKITGRALRELGDSRHLIRAALKNTEF